MMIVLTAFRGKLQSKPFKWQPTMDEFLVPLPFENMSIQTDIVPAWRQSHFSAGRFKATGRRINGAEEWTLVGLSQI